MDLIPGLGIKVPEPACCNEDPAQSEKKKYYEETTVFVFRLHYCQFRKSREELFELIEDFGRNTRYKIRIQKSIDYHIDCNKNEKLEM